MENKYTCGQGIANILDSTLDKQRAAADMLKTRTDLQKVLEEKRTQLQKYSEHNRLLEAKTFCDLYLFGLTRPEESNSYEYRIDLMDERNRASLVALDEARKKTDELRAELEVEKGKQNVELKIFEKQLSDLSVKFQTGVDHYTNADQLKQDLNALQSTSKNIQQELADVKAELQKVMSEMDDMDSIASVDSTTKVTDGNMPAVLKELVAEVEKHCQTHEEEISQAQGNLKNLHRISTALVEEVGDMRVSTGAPRAAAE